MKDHPLAGIFPLMAQSELDELATDIKARGQRAPITTYEGKILDGRNRHRACLIAKAEPKFREFKNGEDPLSFILSANLHRRHLTTGQRAMVAAEIARLAEGRPKLGSPNKTTAPAVVSQSQAAQMVGVSVDSVQRAKTVLQDKAQAKAVKSGEKELNTAAKEIAAKKKTPQDPLDETGYPIPDEILDDWKRADGWSAYLRKLSEVRTALKDGLEAEDVILREVTNTTIATIGNAYRDISCVIPFAVCPVCQARGRKTCQMCKQRGWISKFLWHAVPSELKAVREKAAKK